MCGAAALRAGPDGLRQGAVQGAWLAKRGADMAAVTGCR